MQEQLTNQLIQILRERANLDPAKAEEVTRIVLDFAREHLPELAQAVMGDRGGNDLLGGLGRMLGGRG